MQNKGTTINFTVYVPGQISVPNVVGLQYQDASDPADRGEAAGRPDPGRQQRSRSARWSAQDPKAYTQVAAADRWSPCRCPTARRRSCRCVGQKQADAINALNSAGFANVKVVTQNTTDKTQDGIVLSMSPQSGSFPTSQQITLTVGKYVLPPCPPTTPPTRRRASPASVQHAERRRPRRRRRRPRRRPASSAGRRRAPVGQLAGQRRGRRCTAAIGVAGSAAGRRSAAPCRRARGPGRARSAGPSPVPPLSRERDSAVR